jgi:hypothetical protein
MKTPPLKQVEEMMPDGYFACAAELLKVKSPRATDQPTLAQRTRFTEGAYNDWSDCNEARSCYLYLPLWPHVPGQLQEKRTGTKFFSVFSF